MVHFKAPASWVHEAGVRCLSGSLDHLLLYEKHPLHVNTLSGFQSRDVDDNLTGPISFKGSPSPDSWGLTNLADNGIFAVVSECGGHAGM